MPLQLLSLCSPPKGSLLPPPDTAPAAGLFSSSRDEARSAVRAVSQYLTNAFTMRRSFSEQDQADAWSHAHTSQVQALTTFETPNPFQERPHHPHPLQSRGKTGLGFSSDGPRPSSSDRWQPNSSPNFVQNSRETGGQNNATRAALATSVPPDSWLTLVVPLYAP